MSNFFDKMKYFFGLNEDDELVDNSFSQEQNYEKVVPQSKVQPQQQQYTKQEFEKPSIVTNNSYYRNKPTKEVDNKPMKKMTICKYSPISYDETTSIIDDIKNGFPVIINFESTEDFASANILKACEGGAYALNAEIKKIANEIFLIVPDSIDVLSHMASSDREN